MFPNIYYLGGHIETYNLCMLLTFFALMVAVPALKPKEIPLGYTVAAVIVVFLCSLIGAKLLHIILNFSRYRGRNIIDMFSRSGVAYLGAPILGLLGFWILCRIVKMPFVVFGDYIAPFFMLDRIIGRLGCLGYGCCYGIPSTLPWAYKFAPWGIIGRIVPRHPTQAYAMIYAIAIFASSRYLYKKLKGRGAPGITILYVFFCYGVLRFINEFLRAEGPFVYGAIKASHIGLFALAIGTAIGLFITIKKSTARVDILKALRGAFLRLVIWLVVSAIPILLAIHYFTPSR